MIKRIKTSIYARSPRLTKKKLAGKGFIFMLHRILPQKEREEFTWNRGLAISPEKLEEWVLFFKSKNFDIVSIDEALKRCEIKGSRKFVVITMDDGYWAPPITLTRYPPVPQSICNGPCSLTLTF